MCDAGRRRNTARPVLSVRRFGQARAVGEVMLLEKGWRVYKRKSGQSTAAKRPTTSRTGEPTITDASRPDSCCV